MPYDIRDKNGNYIGTLTESVSNGVGGVLAVLLGIPLLMLLVFAIAVIIWPAYDLHIAYKRLEIPIEWVYAQAGKAFLSSLTGLLLPVATFLFFLVQRACLKSKRKLFVLFLLITAFEFWFFLMQGNNEVANYWYLEFGERMISLGYETHSQGLDRRDSYLAKYILGFWIGLFYACFGTGLSVIMHIRYRHQEKIGKL